MLLTVETCVARHIGDRREQQDRVDLLAHPRRGGTVLAVLADGMGGHSGGAMAAEQVLLKARQNFDCYAPASETPQALLAGIINEAHLVIRLTRFTSEKDPHSTAVVLLLQPDRVDWAHCGDSRLYHFRGADMVCRSEDHSVVGELMRKGRIDAAAANNHPRRNVLVSCLGSEREPKIEFGRAAPLLAGDSFVLCSDGLWGYFDDAELGAVVAAHSARDAAAQLVQGARQRATGAGDNISLLIIKLVAARQKGG